MNAEPIQPPLSSGMKRQSIKLNVGREDLIKIREGKLWQVVGQVIPPIQKDGNTFSFGVLSVQVGQDLESQQRGRDFVLC
jgi:hypothetical protein